MYRDSQWKEKIFKINDAGFEELALEIFQYQYRHNPVYKQYVQALQTDPRKVSCLNQIPFLPIRFFKTHVIQSGSFETPQVFESSGTTATGTSRHYVYDLSVYEESLLRGFELFYGPVRDFCIIGLLPSFSQKKNSSLAFMVDRFIKKTGHPLSGFYLDRLNHLGQAIRELKEQNQKTLVLGVSFALLDLAERSPIDLEHCLVMETGGMKGRRREMIREELHNILKKAFSVPVIHAEYGMTELLSQAYSKGEGVFLTPHWMKVFVRDEEDPFRVREDGSGVLNIIDLANVHSCSFIATDDAGNIDANGNFKVLGRIDNTDLRGCSLLVS